MKAALLPDRGVLKVAGDDARSFLHGLVSADILRLGTGEARFCALLSPQGKIIADSSKSLMRMLGPSGNPQARNLFEIVQHLQRKEGVRFKLRAAAAGADR